MKRLLTLALALLAGEAVAQRNDVFRVELTWSQKIAWPVGMTSKEADAASQLEYVQATDDTVIWIFDCKKKEARYSIKGRDVNLTFRIYGMVVNPRNNLYVFECGTGEHPDWKTTIQEKKNGTLRFLSEAYYLEREKNSGVFSDAVTVTRVTRVTP